MNRLAMIAVLVLVAALSSAAPVIGSTTDLLVTTTSDATNGDTSSVAALAANPGPDGVSLREAIVATNNDLGTHTIRFAASLKGATIALGSDLTPLTGGGVTIEGDIDGDGRPDVTLSKTSGFTRTYCPSNGGGCGVTIASSGNRLRGLTMVGFGIGVDIEPWGPGSGLPPTHQSVSNNVVSGLVLRGIQGFGVLIGSVYNPNCGLFAGHPEPCWTYDTWSNTTIMGNTIEAGSEGIAAKISNAGDRVEDITITDNTIQITGQDADVGIGLEALGNATGVTITGGLIARNSISGRVFGMYISAGANRAQANIVERVQVLDNRLNLVSSDSLCCMGIVVQAGSDAASAIFPNVLPLAYPDGNETRNVLVRGNTISGTLTWGFGVQAGFGTGGSSNSVHDVQFQHNTVTSSTKADGIVIWTAGGGPPIGNRDATGNQIARIAVEANRFATGNAPSSQLAATSAIMIIGGGAFGRNGSVRDVPIVNNVIAPLSGRMLLIGGTEGGTGNQLDGVQVINDTVADQAVSGLEIISNESPDKGTAGNSVSRVTVLNSIFTGSFAGEVTPSMVSSSIVADPSFAGVNGNIQADPKFVDSGNVDFHLQAGSPAIDAGTSTGAPAVDFDGLLRSDGRIDIGAYEFGGAAPPPPNPCTTTGTPASTTYLPNITRRLGGPNGWDTPFYIQNAGTTPSTFEASFYYFDTGALATCHKTTGVAPGASILDDPNLASDLTDDKQYSVVVRSFGAPAVATVNQSQTSGGLIEALSYGGFSSGATKVYVPNVTRRFFGYDIPLIIQNLGTSTAFVTANFKSFDGTQSVNIPLTIGVGLSGVIDPDYTAGLTDGTQYSVTVTSNQPVAVVANAHDEAIGPVAFSHNGLASGATTVYGPWATKSTSTFSNVVVQNLGTAAATATLTFKPTSGAAAQAFTTASIPAGGASAFDVRFTSGIALAGAAPCGSAASATCLGDGDYGLSVASSQQIAAVVLPNSNTLAGAYLAAANVTTKVLAPIVQRNLSGWNSPIWLQSVTATSATLNFYVLGTGALATSLPLSLTAGTTLRVDPAAVTGLANGQQYSLAVDANGTIAATVQEFNAQAGDGLMVYEAFPQ